MNEKMDDLKMDDLKFEFIMGLMLSFVLLLLFGTLMYHGINKAMERNKVCDDNMNVTRVINILSISVGGWGHQDKCLYETTNKNLEASCDYNPGDLMPLAKMCRDYGIKVD